MESCSSCNFVIAGEPHVIEIAQKDQNGFILEKESIYLCGGCYADSIVKLEEAWLVETSNLIDDDYEECGDSDYEIEEQVRCVREQWDAIKFGFAEKPEQIDVRLN